MQTVIGLFENAHAAQQAAQKLMSNGFASGNVDVTVKGNSSSYPDNLMTNDPADTYPGTVYTNSDDTTGEKDRGDREYEQKDEDFGEKISSFFRNLFGSDDDNAERYSHVANQTGCVVTVYTETPEEANRACDILDDNGAINVDESAVSYGYMGTRINPTTSDRLSDESNDESRVEMGDEESNASKDLVRVQSKMVEPTIQEHVRLREESVKVERIPVDRAATAADLRNLKEGEIEMTEYTEEADVLKEARLVEEVKLSKEVDERIENINETARDTEVDIENLESKKKRKN